jgi:Icc-related predicted phosphoesterase
MKIWYISDTHNNHSELTIPICDMVIFGGDCTNHKNIDINKNEIIDFLTWFKSLNIKHKVMISGNHDRAISHDFDFEGIYYLEHESVTIEGIKIFGSPYTPKFGKDWMFNVDRDKIHTYWEQIPKDTDILITHGPPKGILDLTQFDSRPGSNERNDFFQCGCASLFNIVTKIQPKYHMFGHIHTEKNCINSGMLKLPNYKTTFINASVSGFIRNSRFVKATKELHNNGTIIDY